MTSLSNHSCHSKVVTPSVMASSLGLVGPVSHFVSVNKAKIKAKQS